MKMLRILKWAALTLLLVVVIWFSFAYWSSTNDCGKLPAAENPMKAIVYCDYGPGNLKLDQVEKRAPDGNQILVRVRAASVNPFDWHYIEGTPYIMRPGIGLRKPKDIRLGVDFAGTIEAVGKNVSQFKPGDEVFGGRTGAFAEYVLVREDRAIVPKPANITFEQAASVPIAGITALQALRDQAKIQPGQKVLINGASGGVGTFAVQIAKSLGANVTGVCSTRNVDLVRSLGADQVIDYTKDDFAKGAERYDAILDNVPNHPLAECRHVLTRNGRYVMIGGGGPNDNRWIGPLGRIIHTAIVSPFVSQKMGMFVADLKKADLTALADLMRAGKLKPVIDRTYKLSALRTAIEYVEQGHARGKVIVTPDFDEKL